MQLLIHAICSLLLMDDNSLSMLSTASILVLMNEIPKAFLWCDRPRDLVYFCIFSLFKSIKFSIPVQFLVNYNFLRKMSVYIFFHLARYVAVLFSHDFFLSFAKFIMELLLLQLLTPNFFVATEANYSLNQMAAGLMV